MIGVQVGTWGRSLCLKAACVACGICFVSALAGCESSAEKEMGFQSEAPIVPKSESITKFMGPEGMTSLYMSFDEIGRNTASTRAAVSQPKFIEAFEAFKNEAIPKEFASEQRDQAKTKFVHAVDALIEAVKKNAPDEEIRTLAKPVRPAAENFMRPTNY